MMPVLAQGCMHRCLLGSVHGDDDLEYVTAPRIATHVSLMSTADCFRKVAVFCQPWLDTCANLFDEVRSNIIHPGDRFLIGAI